MPAKLPGVAHMTKRSIILVALAPLFLGAVGSCVLGWQLSRPVPASVGPPPPDLAAAPVAFRSETGLPVQSDTQAVYAAVIGLSFHAVPGTRFVVVDRTIPALPVSDLIARELKAARMPDALLAFASWVS